MTSHELAGALQLLAKILRNSPDVDISELSFRNPRVRSTQEIAVNLETLIGLSSIDKQTWSEFIAENHFPIEIRPRDASRDVLGKLLNYLEQNPDAREHLKVRSQRQSGGASQELLNALGTLLRGTHEPS